MDFLLFPYVYLSHLDHISSYISPMAISNKIFPLFYFFIESWDSPAPTLRTGTIAQMLIASVQKVEA